MRGLECRLPAPDGGRGAPFGPITIVAPVPNRTSSAGKSSLLRVLAGLQKPTAGIVRLNGRKPTDRSWHRRVGYLPQEPDLAGGVTVEDTVLLAAWLKGVSRRELRPTARRALAQVGLTDRARDRVRTLSGGMRRRLSLATAVAHLPELLLLDEPTAGLARPGIPRRDLRGTGTPDARGSAEVAAVPRMD